MQRTKLNPVLQLTRIMPRRGKRRHSTTDEGDDLPRKLTLRGQKMVKEVTGENSSRSKSTSETMESASASAQGRHSSRQKRKRVDPESGTCSEVAPTNEASSLIDSLSNRESPELSCSICLGTVENRAFTDACYHTFCFECLVEWSRVRAVCPLCKKSFHSIIHSFRSYDDYKRYQVPTSYVSNLVNISSINNSEPLNLSRVGRFFNSNGPMVLNVNDADRMLALRRRVYTHSEEMELRGLWSSDGVVVSPPNEVSPAMFEHYPLMLERVRPWVLRDVAVIIGNGDIHYVAGIVLGLLRHFPITSEDFYERLFPYFGLHTRRFLLELDAFARSHFDISTYDARVVYSTGANVEESRHLPTEHVEDISSSDDSDIEIVTPTVIASAAEPTLDNHVNTMTGRVVPDLLHRLHQTFQESLLQMSLSFMNRQGHHSELDSPVPGPSGIGQAVITDESDSVGSHAPGSVYDAEERSNSPMVLSDADSDVMVVDVDRLCRSPIHISSGEDDDTARRIRARRRVKRRMRRERAHAERRSEFEQSDGLTSTADRAAENVLQGDEALSRSELPAASHKPADQSLEPTVEDRVHVEEQTENSYLTQKQSASHSGNVKLNDQSSASFKLSSSQTCLQMDNGKVADTARNVFHHAHPKRSRSASSVSNMPVGSLSSTDDVKLLTCKKHISGHKSSKQKAREVVAEKKSAEAVNDSAEKSVIGECVGVADGSHDVTDADCNEHTSNDLPKEVKVLSIGESSIACADFSSSRLSVRSSAEELISNRELAADGQLHEGMPVPSTSETCSLPAPSSDCDSENVQGSSVLTAEVTVDTVHPCLPAADENLSSCGATVYSNSYDMVQTHSEDIHELPENAVTVALDCGKINDCEHETPTASVLSSDNLVSGNNNVACSATESVHPGIILSACANTVITTCLPSLPELLSHFDACMESSDCSSEPSCNVSMSAATSSSSNSQMHLHEVESCKLKNEGINMSDHQPIQDHSNDSLPIVPLGNETVLIADDSFHQDLQLNTETSCLCTDSVSSENWSLLASCDALSTVSRTDFDGTDLVDFSLTEQTGSARSVFHDIIESPASPNPVVNDSILSPVGLDSSDSDSEVEWLETGVSGRQRCISISSGCSSVVCSPLDEVESVLLDTDSMEMFDDELRLSAASLCPSLESQYQTHDEQLPQVHSAPLPSTSDVASVDTDQVEKAMNSEQVSVEHEGESHNTNDAVIVGDVISERSSDIPLYINPTADAYDQDTDIEDVDSQQ